MTDSKTIPAQQQLDAAQQRQAQLDDTARQAQRQLDDAAAARAEVLARAARGATVSSDELVSADGAVRRQQAAVELARLVAQTGAQAIAEAQHAVWQEQASAMRAEFEAAQAAVERAAAAFSQKLDAARQALADVIAAQTQRNEVFQQARGRDAEARRLHPGDATLQVALPMAVRHDGGAELRLVTWNLNTGFHIALPDFLPQ